MVTRFTRGVPRLEWVRSGRNEGLDAEVYAYAAAIRAGMQRLDWNLLEKAVEQSSTNVAKRGSQPRTIEAAGCPRFFRSAAMVSPRRLVPGSAPHGTRPPAKPGGPLASL